jgi:acetyl-CoA carboxylase carboxyl transferase subunit beta
MAWFRKEREERKPQREKLEIPHDAWDKCSSCGTVDLRDKFQRSLMVCHNCGHHGKIPAHTYIDLITDPDSFKEMFGELGSVDALGFQGYPDKLAKAYAKVGKQDAIVTGNGTIHGVAINIGAMEFAFMGGSMGSVVGEKIARLALRSLKEKEPLILVSTSGGARMQEGVLSLMQLAKTSSVIAALKEEGIPFISVMTNPTTGGVSASFAMQGDINIGEPKAVIGFAGARVIKQTIGQDLPEGFQKSEFLLEHGMLDMVVSRLDMKDTLGRLLRMFADKNQLEATG